MTLHAHLEGNETMHLLSGWPRADVISLFALIIAVLAALVGILMLRSIAQRTFWTLAILIVAAIAGYSIAMEAKEAREAVEINEKARREELIREATIRAQQAFLEQQTVELGAKAALNQAEIERQAHAEIAREVALKEARARILKDQALREKREEELREEQLLKQRRTLIIGKWISEATGKVVEYLPNGTINKFGLEERWEFISSNKLIASTWCCRFEQEIIELSEDTFKIRLETNIVVIFKRATK